MHYREVSLYVHNAGMCSSSVFYCSPSPLPSVRAIYDYIKDRNNELSFVAGTIIYVVKNDDSWFEGITSSGTGLFPGTMIVETVAAANMNESEAYT